MIRMRKIQKIQKISEYRADTKAKGAQAKQDVIAKENIKKNLTH